MARLGYPFPEMALQFLRKEDITASRADPKSGLL
jgi:hypothetical protein